MCDSVSWRETALGGEMLTNYTQGERYEVYVQNHHVHQSQLRQQTAYSVRQTKSCLTVNERRLTPLYNHHIDIR